MSIIAIGQIDRKLIYRKRKGFDDVKKYTKTVNPDMPGQQTQKGYFRNAINEWTTAGYSSIDIQAWNVYASTKKVTASGFNRFTGLKINAEKEGKTWTKLTNCNIYDVTGEGFKVDIDVESDLSGKLYIGTSKYSMLKEFIGVFLVDKYTFTVTGLEKSKVYYFYIKNTSANENARTGIYKQRTTIAVFIDITIGQPAINRSGFSAVGYTQVNMGVPANASGKIKTIEMWCYISLENAKVATFFEVSENYLSTRAYQNIGDVEAGSKRIIPVDIDVVAGDFIGFYSLVGRLESTPSGEIGVWRTGTDKIPCINQYFGIAEGDAISLFGEGKG